MSTRIEHGWRLRRSVDPFRLIRELRPPLEIATAHRMAELAVRGSVARLDRARRFGDPEPEAPLSSAMELIDTLTTAGPEDWAARYPEDAETAGESEPRRRGDSVHRLWQFEVVLLQDPGEVRPVGAGELLALTYPERAAVAHLDLWAAHPAVSPWPYWNNTDRPAEVSEEEWEHRREVWRRSMPEFAAGDNGLRFLLYAGPVSLPPELLRYAPPERRAELVRTYFPPPEARARKLARRRLDAEVEERGLGDRMRRTGSVAGFTELMTERMPELTAEELDRLPEVTPGDLLAGFSGIPMPEMIAPLEAPQPEWAAEVLARIAAGHRSGGGDGDV